MLRRKYKCVMHLYELHKDGCKPLTLLKVLSAEVVICKNVCLLNIRSQGHLASRSVVSGGLVWLSDSWETLGQF